MIVYEVCAMDQNGALDEPYYLQCDSIEEAHANVGDRHGEDAVIIRMRSDHVAPHAACPQR